jgi:ATP-dependent helicase/nuclease subunit B
MDSVTLPVVLEVLEAGGGARVLLPNARAAATVRTAFDARQRARGVTAWESPAVLSWGQWMSSVWSELVVQGHEERLLLNAAQEHSVWRELITEDAASGGYGSVDALAELAQSGWALAASYEVVSKLRGAATTHDSRVFAEWAEGFGRRCKARGYLSAALLEEALAEHARAGRPGVREALWVVGFEAMTPSQASLLEALRDAGVEVQKHALAREREEGVVRAAVTAHREREELQVAVDWIRGFVAERQAAGLGASVAVVVPQVDEVRAELEEVLRERLAPELEWVEADLSGRPWAFAGGEPLASVTMVADALTLARWAEGALLLERVSALLRSPYVGANASGEELEASARFDVGTLRRTLRLRSEISIAAVVELLRQDEARHGRALLPWVRDVQTTVLRAGELSAARSYAEWMEFVRELLRAANWPGERQLNAYESEAARAWDGVLDAVATLDFAGRRVPFSAALHALDLQTQKMAFAAESAEAPVQLMGMAAAEGSVFDAVVLLRATDNQLPAAERVHPLIGWALQRSLRMPGSSAAVTAESARRKMASLLERSGSVVVTAAAEDHDGKLRGSPMVEEFGIERVDVASLVPGREEAVAVAMDMVQDDEPIPALTTNEVKGGAKVLQLQAACGFLAFATLRLRATEVERGELGLDAGESGSLLHRALQGFWNEVRSQERLKAMDWAERDALLTKAIEAALPRRLKTESEWDAAYVGLQKERLRTVLQQWLGEELKRGPFTIVDSEHAQAVTVGPLTLDVRFDRIDRLEDGGFFLVDYKTGYAADPKQWEGERPDEPQLPLYALLNEEHELRGMAFAKVRAGREMKWAGYQAEEGILPGKSKNNVRDLATLMDEWRVTLTQLAVDFAEGKADVRPKSYAVNCVRCAQRLLCRLDPSTLLESAGNDEDEQEEIDG